MDQYFSPSLSKGNPKVKHAQVESDLPAAIIRGASLRYNALATCSEEP